MPLLLVWIALTLTGVSNGVSASVSLLLAIIGVVLGVRGVRALTRRSIWRLRNRLMVTYVFIGVVPIILILILAGIGAYFVAGQVAVYLASSELERRTAALRGPATILSRTPNENRGNVVREIAPFLRDRFPNVEMLVRGGEEYRYPRDSILSPLPPGWKNHSGLVLKDRNFYSLAHVTTGESQVVLLAPITHEFLSSLVPHLGNIDLMQISSDGSDLIPGHHVNNLAPAVNLLDREVTWGNPVTITHWEDPGKTETTLLIVKTRPSAMLGAVFGQNFKIAQGIFLLFLAVAVLFLLVELVSLIIGVSLTRSITRAVHNLYVGTKKVTAGDFSHRIEVRGGDQLAELGASFNSMTEHLERLISVEKEKERLQSELEIAKEVQYQLFPKAVPTLRTLELTGTCHPARMVSGDYYDFLCLQNNIVALAIGDVAGKGISAALLMASIQSIVRTQLSAGIPAMAAAAGNGHAHAHFSTSYIVSQLNKQLYANTAPEKYATFCFALYDEERKSLSYTNAGHLPPILLRNGQATLLEVTGTVVGAFPMSRYEEKTVDLVSGDVLLAYTDGVTEPENEFGEEFGVDRMVELLVRHQGLDAHEISARIMEAVQDWNHAAELPDDMTLLLAR
ncbi:MAG: SpoIIE family protein phosphatase [Acidobacteriota bacterium]|nr:SpoIIE family protein phosphatase [Acidobacteriota bacterium]